MGDFFDITSDRADFFLILVDSSGSMSGDELNVRKGLKMFKESFEDFELANSIIVSVCKFAGDFYPSYFRPVAEMDTSYSTGGGTALSYSIVQAKRLLDKYITAFVERTKIIPKVTFVCISDGQPCSDPYPLSRGQNAIEEMNCEGITTAFAALGSDMDSSFGRNMGFMATVDVTNRNALLNFLGVELSNSCKEQSKSMKSLGGSFFSQANEQSQSQEYSQTTAQALDDRSWIDDI